MFHVKSNRLNSLGDRYKLNSRQLSQLGTVLRELQNHEDAPTAVREEERAADVHLADSLTALELDVVSSAETIADTCGHGAASPCRAGITMGMRTGCSC